MSNQNKTAKMIQLDNINNVSFVGSKNCYGYQEVVDGFAEAKEVRILTYSRIGSSFKNGYCLSKLRDVKPGTKVKIIISLAGVMNEKDENGKYIQDVYNREKIIEIFNRMKEDLELSKFKTNDVQIGISFTNHSKLIGTDKILYIGSENFSDASQKNYEAGFIIRDQETISSIYSSFFNEVRCVYFHKNIYEPYIGLLEFMSENLSVLENKILQVGIDYYGRKELREEILDICNSLISKIEAEKECMMGGDVELSEEEFEEISNNPIHESKVYEEQVLDESICLLSEIIENIDMVIPLGENESYYVDHYEEWHKEDNKVYCEDQILEDGFPYQPLRECIDMEEKIEKYWIEEFKENKEWQEMCQTVSKYIDLLECNIKEYNDNPEKYIQKSVEKSVILVGSDPHIQK